MSRLLTEKERAVWALLAEGLSTKEICKRIGRESGTVRFHIHNVFFKLNVRNRTEAALAYVRQA